MAGPADGPVDGPAPRAQHPPATFVPRPSHAPRLPHNLFPDMPGPPPRVAPPQGAYEELDFDFGGHAGSAGMDAFLPPPDSGNGSMARNGILAGEWEGRGELGAQVPVACGKLNLTINLPAASPVGVVYPNFDPYCFGPAAMAGPAVHGGAFPASSAFGGRNLAVTEVPTRTPSFTYSDVSGGDGPKSGGSPDNAAAEPERPVRKRVANACDQCFQRKAACDGQSPCARCIKLELECQRTRVRKKPGPPSGSAAARKRKAEASPAGGTASENERSPISVLDSQFSLGRPAFEVPMGLSPYGVDGSLMRPSDEAAKEMIHAFFRKTYHMSFPFLHKPTFLRTFRQQPPYLQFAMFANAARFASQRDIADRPRTASLHFYEHAKATLEPTMLRLPSLLPQETVAVVQTLILLMNYAAWAGSSTLGSRYITLAVMVARQAGMNREVRDLLRDARTQARKRQAGTSLFPPLASDPFGGFGVAVEGAGTEEAEELERLHAPRDAVAALSSMTPLDEEIRRRTWFVTFYCACAWSLSTNTTPLVGVTESQVNLPLTERDFRTLNQQSAAIAAHNGGGLALDAPSTTDQSHLTLPSRIGMGWPDFEPASRELVLRSTVASTASLAAQGNLVLMAQAFGIVSRVLAVKQRLRQHETGGPFCPNFPPSLAGEWLAAERAADEFWAALPPELVSGAAWDAMASDDSEYSEVVPGVLIVFLMARMSLHSPDRLPRSGAPMEPREEETRRRWVGSEQFLRCVDDARTMAQVLKKLYIRNPEALDYMKGLVVVGVHGSALVLLELVRGLRASRAHGVEELVAGTRRDVGYHIRSLRGVQHNIAAAGKLADQLEGELAMCI
ncbi:fungal-specific transcription factor domain-containing protein [Hyaloraphidium curvatum]|nr:fungal-specific transcription factor domain-containing protein [Hyaloraphidium curvatum]